MLLNGGIDMSIHIQEKQVQSSHTCIWGSSAIHQVQVRPIFRSFQRLSSGQDFGSRESIFNHSCCVGCVQNQLEGEPSARGPEGSGPGSCGWCRHCCPASLQWCVGQVRSTGWAPQTCSASTRWAPKCPEEGLLSRLMKCCSTGGSSAAGAQPYWVLS